MQRPAPTSLAHLPDVAPADAVAELTAVAGALPALADPGALEQLARSLPAAVAGLAPEVSLALQGVAMALAAHGPRLPRDLDALEPRLRVAWRRVRLAAADPDALAGLTDADLLPLVHGWTPDPLPDPAPLLRRMAAAADPRLRARALEWTAPAVRQLALTPADAFAWLAPLAADVDPELRLAALAALCEGWVRGLPPAAERARERLVVDALADDDPRLARAGVAAAAALGRRDWLLELLADDARPGPARADALDALGPLAQDDDLDLALALAAADPLRFAPPARRCLLAAHRHGVFLRARHLDALLAAYDAHPPWTGEELVRVAHIVRGELLDRLAALPADDPRWPRRAAILGASVDPRAAELLRARLDEVRDPTTAAALLDAAARNPDDTGEPSLLRWLDVLPEAALPALRVKGGPGAEPRLRARVLDPRCPPAARAAALAVLWSLARDRPALLRELSARLGPHESGLLDGRHAHRDRGVADLLADPPWPDHPADLVDPTRRLELLCDAGELDHLPRIVELFRELFRGHVRQALAGDFTVKRLALPALEQQLFRYGRHLLRDGRSVRRWLDDAPETGRDLVLRVALDWLREEPADAVCVALLELVGRHAPGPTELRRIEPLWRHRDREVRRAALEAILAAGEGARGLELSLGRLADHDEPRILAQALAAVATLRAAWAEPLVIAALRRPEMDVKKAAAHALAEIAGPAAISPLVEWLAHHDNRGLRGELLAALRRAAGPAFVAVLVDALTHETEPRRAELLADAVSGHLPLAAALRLARSPHPAHQRLLAACLDGRVALADADAERLAAQLHRARLRTTPPPPDPGRRLRIEGFSPEAARALVDQRAPALEPAILATVRAALADWIAWLAGSPDPRALALVLDAATPSHTDHLEPLLARIEQTLEPARERTALDAAPPRPLAARPDLDTAPPARERTAPASVRDDSPARPRASAPHARLDPPLAAAVAGFLERCLAGRGAPRALEVRGVCLLRALPPSSGFGGLRRWRLLARLGAVRTRDDLERCLDETRLGPDLARDSATLLAEALAIPAARDDEPPELADLRASTRRWHAQPPPDRAAWLTAALAARPLDLPVVDPHPAPPRPRVHPASQADLDLLRVTLHAGDEQERSRAAARLLDWPDAHAAWPDVLAVFLQGRLVLAADHRARLAPLLTRWPDDRVARDAARELLPHCPPHRRREFVRAWLTAWDAGDPDVADLLRGVDDELLLPHAWAAAERGDDRPMHLLRPGGSRSLRDLVALVAARAPDAVAHLLPAAESPAPDADEPDDPIAGRDADELAALIDRPGVARGLAVRAVHALVEHGERGVAPLERLVVDPRPPVRSAALRALRKVATREATLHATARALAIESRTDVTLGLMRSLGHGRHEPALPALLERFEHRDPRVRDGARAAIRAWGRDVAPALRRAARHARPDRRPAYHELLAELELLDEPTD
jgi:hypothetical protein